MKFKLKRLSRTIKKRTKNEFNFSAIKNNVLHVNSQSNIFPSFENNKNSNLFSSKTIIQHKFSHENLPNISIMDDKKNSTLQSFNNEINNSLKGKRNIFFFGKKKQKLNFRPMSEYKNLNDNQILLRNANLPLKDKNISTNIRRNNSVIFPLQSNDKKMGYKNYFDIYNKDKNYLLGSGYFKKVHLK